MKKQRHWQRSDLRWLAGAALLILLQFWWLPGDPGAAHDTYSTTIEGELGFFRQLSALSEAGHIEGRVLRESSRLVPEQPATLLMLGPGRYPNQDEQGELRDFVYNGGVLVFAPRWDEPETELSGLSIRLRSTVLGDALSMQGSLPAPEATVSTTPQPAEDGNAPLQAEASETPEASDVPEGSKGAGESAESPAAEDGADDDSGLTAEAASSESESAEADTTEVSEDPSASEPADADTVAQAGPEPVSVESRLVSGPVDWRSAGEVDPPRFSGVDELVSFGGQLQVATWPMGRGRVMVAASADVFSNRSMLFDDSAELAFRLVELAHNHHESSSADVVFCEYLTMSNQYRGTAVLLGPVLRNGSLQLLLVAVLAGWYGFHRFGPALLTRRYDRRSLSESAAAVGNLQFTGHNGHEAVAVYREYVFATMRRLFGLSFDPRDIRGVAVRCGMKEEAVRAVLDAANSVIIGGHASNADSAEAIRGLSRLRQAVVGRKEQPMAVNARAESSDGSEEHEE